MLQSYEHKIILEKTKGTDKEFRKIDERKTPLLRPTRKPKTTASEKK